MVLYDVVFILDVYEVVSIYIDSHGVHILKQEIWVYISLHLSIWMYEEFWLSYINVYGVDILKFEKMSFYKVPRVGIV